MKIPNQAILTLIITSLTLYLWNKASDQPQVLPLKQAPVPSSPHARNVRQPSKKTIPDPFAIRSHPPSLPVDTHPSYREPPEGNKIEFQVVNGNAIAYGDVMLGQLEEGSPLNRGLYDAPTPLIWDKPEIPYKISPDLPHPERIEEALHYLRQNTPLQFLPLQNQTDGLIFVPGEEHCYSYLGRIGGIQPITLSDRCEVQEILHEVLHALGLMHEQSRPDRDDYIDILWANIQPEFQSQFALVPEVFFENLKGTHFDYQSIMLYKPSTFSIDPALVTLKSKGLTPVYPVVKGISSGDVSKILRLYRM